jgi:hypothetical protein
MSLDEKIGTFLSKAATKEAASKLEPYAELIRTLRQRRWTYSEIADTLRTEFGLTVHRTTVHAFVKARSGNKPGPFTMASPVPGNSPGAPVSTSPKRQRFNLDA